MQPQPDGKKKKKKTKGNGLPPNGQGKKKNRGSKKLPLQLFATFPSGTLTDDGEVMKIDATIIYHKTATMALEIAFKDVKLRNEVLNSYDVHMFEPGYGVSLSEGTLCDLMGSTFKIQNPCPYVLYVRMQRPMGFRDDPSALGMWEPIGGVLIHEIKPGQILTLGSPNSSTDHMVPREDTVAGKRTVHLFSFTVFRDAMSISAANPNQASIDKEIALVLEVITRFKSSNGDVGEQDLYTVESFSGSERLNHVVKGPLVPLRLCDVSSPEGPITFASLNRDHDLKGFKPYCLSFFSGKKAATATTLDKKTIYRTSFIETLIDPISNKNFNASYICNMAFSDGTHNWVLGTIQSDGNFLPGNTNEKWSTGVITGGDWLYPLSPNAKSVFSTRRGEAIKGLQSFRHATSYREIKTSELMIGQTLLTALVIIYHVSKVAMEVLEIAGVIKNEDVRLRSAVRKLSLS